MNRNINSKLLCLFVFLIAAGLVSNGTGGFARGLAGRLAFAATTVLGTLLQCRRGKGFDVFHVSPLLSICKNYTTIRQ
jgi:hypothetical protein